MHAPQGVGRAPVGHDHASAARPQAEKPHEPAVARGGFLDVPGSSAPVVAARLPGWRRGCLGRSTPRVAVSGKPIASRSRSCGAASTGRAAEPIAGTEASGLTGLSVAWLGHRFRCHPRRPIVRSVGSCEDRSQPVAPILGRPPRDRRPSHLLRRTGLERRPFHPRFGHASAFGTRRALDRQKANRSAPPSTGIVVRRSRPPSSTNFPAPPSPAPPH